MSDFDDPPYTMTDENGTYYIRWINGFPDKVYIDG